MAIVPPPQVDFGRFGNIGLAGAVDPTKFSRTGSVNTDPGAFQVMLAQSMNNSAFNILFGTDEDSSDSTFGSGGSSSGSSSSVFGEDVLGSSASSPLSSNLSTGASPALEMITRSNLIGKTVEALLPGTKQTFTGKVESVNVNGGTLLINVGGTNVPPENLIKVTE